MPSKLTQMEQEMIMMLLLDRWNPAWINDKIANHFDLTVEQVERIRAKKAFLDEYDRQLAIYEGHEPFPDLKSRRGRVLALQGLLARLPERRVSLKLKILRQIRYEVEGC